MGIMKVIEFEPYEINMTEGYDDVRIQFHAMDGDQKVCYVAKFVKGSDCSFYDLSEQIRTFHDPPIEEDF